METIPDSLAGRLQFCQNDTAFAQGSWLVYWELCLLSIWVNISVSDHSPSYSGRHWSLYSMQCDCSPGQCFKRPSYSLNNAPFLIPSPNTHSPFLYFRFPYKVLFVFWIIGEGSELGSWYSGNLCPSFSWICYIGKKASLWDKSKMNESLLLQI